MKKAFYYFLTFNILFTVTILVANLFIYNVIDHHMLNRINNWVLFLILLGGSFFYSAKSKKELNTINEMEDFVQKFACYEKYYKKKLIWNAFSLVTSGLFFLLTSKNFFFYVLIIQLVLSLVFYPAKRLLSKELKNPEIVFT